MLAKSTIIRGWKDKAFRASPPEAELQNLPLHPSGLIELPEDCAGVAPGDTVDYLPFSGLGVE